MNNINIKLQIHGSDNVIKDNMYQKICKTINIFNSNPHIRMIDAAITMSYPLIFHPKGKTSYILNNLGPANEVSRP